MKQKLDQTCKQTLSHISKRTGWTAAAFGLVLFLTFLLGGMMEKRGYLGAPTLPELMMALAAGLTGTLAAVLVWSWKAGPDRAGDSGEAVTFPDDPTGQPAAGRLWEKPGRRFMLFFTLLFLVDLVLLLGVYPGFFVYDASEELSMVQSRLFTTHHPLLHVLSLGFVIQLIHKITGSYNAGIFCYSLIQAAIICLVFSWILDRIWRKVGKRMSLWSLAFDILCPAVTMFTLCTCKDGLFSASLIVMFVLLTDLFEDRDTFFADRKKPAAYIAAASLMMLYRNNGVYALLVFSLFWIIGLIAGKKRRGGKESQIRRQLLLILAPVLIYLVLSRSLILMTGAKKGGSQEMLTVPIQQMARTFTQDRAWFSGEDEALMLRLMPEEKWNNYNPALSDQVKVWFDNDVYHQEKSACRNLYFRTALAHPVAFLNAWFGTSYAFWYPLGTIDCYRGNQVFTFTYGDSSYFGYETEKPGERRSLIPAVDRLFAFLSLDIRAQKVPVLRLLYLPGGIFLVWLFLAGDLFVHGDRAGLKAAGLIFLAWLTYLLGPCTLPRYVVYLWFGFPAILARAAQSHRKM